MTHNVTANGVDSRSWHVKVVRMGVQKICEECSRQDSEAEKLGVDVGGGRGAPRTGRGELRSCETVVGCPLPEANPLALYLSPRTALDVDLHSYSAKFWRPS